MMKTTMQKMTKILAKCKKEEDSKKEQNNFVQTNVFCPTISWNRLLKKHNGSVVKKKHKKHAVENKRMIKVYQRCVNKSI